MQVREPAARAKVARPGQARRAAEGHRTVARELPARPAVQRARVEAQEKAVVP
jgi:hypothetical protein